MTNLTNLVTCPTCGVTAETRDGLTWMSETRRPVACHADDYRLCETMKALMTNESAFVHHQQVE